MYMLSAQWSKKQNNQNSTIYETQLWSGIDAGVVFFADPFAQTVQVLPVKVFVEK